MTVTDGKIFRQAQLARQTVIVPPLMDGVLTRPVFSINAGDHTKFDVTAFSYVLGGRVYAKAAATAIAFTAAHVVTTDKWGAIAILIDAIGTVSTLVNAATQTTALAANTEDLAIAAAPAVPADKVLAGLFTIDSTGGNFTCNTTTLDNAIVVAANLLASYPDRRIQAIQRSGKAQVLNLQTAARAGVASTLMADVLAAKSSTPFLSQVLTNPQLEVDTRTKTASSSSTKLRCGAFDYLIGGVLYRTDAQKQLAFTAAHPVTADKWGAILLLIDTAGAYSTLISGATQTTTQAYTNAAAARAALPAVPAGKTAIGVLVIEAKNATWTANTDDIVAASDLENFDLVPALPDRNLSAVTLAIDAVPEKFKSTVAFDTTFDGIRVTKAAATAIAFSAAHVCTASKYLAILIGVNVSGTVSSKVPLIDGRSQTATQGYDSYDLAVAALPTPSAGVQPMGYIVVLADAGGWTAQTDDMVAGVDLTSVWFVGVGTGVKFGLAGLETTRMNELWPITGALWTPNTIVDATLAAGTVGQRADTDQAIAVYLGAKVTAAMTKPVAYLTTRPWPLAGEATS